MERQELGEAILEDYKGALHAMQSGVAMEMNYDDGPTSPKHLRVGVNAAMADHASLAKLLISKGVITEEEYLMALRDGMREEANNYEKSLSRRLGTNVTLG